MANTKEIRRRIRSIENTRQITKAMEMISATKVRRAQAAVSASRAYAETAEGILRAVGSSIETKDHPLLVQRPVKRTGIVMVASDRGSVGAMNTNLTRAVLARATEEKNPVFISVGRKATQNLRRSGELVGTFEGLGDTPGYEEALPIAQLISEEYATGRLDKVLLAFPKFISTMKNQPTVSQLVPAVVEAEAGEPTSNAQTLFEPSPEAVLESLIPRLIEIRLYQAILEMKASEHSSRMIAMHNATDNASDLIDELKFSYNQARQAAITTEIAEIASAAAVA